jgi:glutathione S-transferase
MWQRRVELKITENLYNGFRFAEGIEIFRPRMRVLPEAADGLKAVVRDNLQWLDALLADREFIAGSRFTIADVILYCAVDFGRGVGQAPDPALKNVGAWFERVSTRPSASASLHPASKARGFRG